MSKYIKLDDAINTLYSGFVTKTYIENKLKDLPTIEVSEDCISRAGAIECISELPLDEVIIKQALKTLPSVVPSARPIEMHLDVTDDVVDRAAEQIRKVNEIILNAPSVIPQPKEGEWIADRYSYGTGCYTCSNGGVYWQFTDDTQGSAYCPECGAKMKG